ncbi:phosphoribosyltransferase family protein [Bacillus rubiinfantis]|uniref:phosphoribosyltransferase family protein n=1 Tax=Bacillus rubiinfantis TaxID=1499680 RepID=UPI0005A93260|nr:phosphoribosyltransferase family protein [Bacillus rubiinfantis]
MNHIQTLISSKKTFTFHILDAIDVTIEVSENPYGLPIHELFTMAARINKKRSFLFVSNVLGKHIPIHPKKGLLTAALLAVRYLENIKNISATEKEQLLNAFSNGAKLQEWRLTPFIPAECQPVVIGFAETATALGHGFFSCFENACYFHTTREAISGLDPEVTFEEEHSHATSHRCYIPLELINHNREIILVDDEMTTGKTALNIIKSIHSKFPREKYTVVSILDWRSGEDRRQFMNLEQELGITIRVVSLLSGSVTVNQRGKLTEEDKAENAPASGEMSIEVLDIGSYFTSSMYASIQDPAPFIQETGRFGLNSKQNYLLHQQVSQAAAFLSKKRQGQRTLCLGSGEFMYLPMIMAAEMGEEVYYQSTTRSPIYIKNCNGYGARCRLVFPNPEDPSVTNFVYNILPGSYDEIFIFIEREVDSENLRPFLEELRKTAVNSVKLVFFSKEQR